MDAIEMLVRDHKDAKRAMEAVGRSSGARKKALFETLKRELELHDRLEELVFYPALHAHSKKASFAVKDQQAQDGVTASLAQLSDLAVDEADWEPMFRSLQDAVQKHASDQEALLFTKVRKMMTPAELEDLADKMKVGPPSA
jgi:hypothetical protein